MHKGIILLLKVEDKEEIIYRIKEFMKEYEGNVWDWYVIGGRWSGTLNKNYKRFYELVKEKNIPIQYYSDIEKKETQEQLQEIWIGLGEKSINPIIRDSFKIW